MEISLKQCKEQLYPLQSSKARLVGLDVGTKTVGIAVSDSRWILATPFKTLLRDKFGILMNQLREELAEYKVAAFVIGMPYHMDGTWGPRCQATKDFALNLSKHTQIPYVFWDERLSTVEAEQHLLRADVSRAKRKKVVDKMAARVILQGFLDALGLPL